MPHPYPRSVRIARSVQEVVAPELLGIVGRGLVTVCEVDVTRDLTQARVIYTVMGADPVTTQEKLEQLAPRLRSKLARELAMKKVPALLFQQLPAQRDDPPCMGS